MSDYPSEGIGSVQAVVSSAWFWSLLIALVSSAGCISGPPRVVRVHRGVAEKRDIQPALVEPSRLTITTLNVWGLPKWLNGASTGRYGRIDEAMGKLASDVVLYQEVWTKQSFEDLSELANGPVRKWWSAAARNRGSFLGQNGLLTLSKYPIVHSEVRHFRDSRLPDSLMHKGALKTTVSLPSGQRVNIWNVHLQDGNCPDLRARQVRELVEWVCRSEDGQTADVVGGDFNFNADSEEFAAFTAAIGPSAHQIAGMKPAPTWDGLKPMEGGGETLDHIFIRQRASNQSIQARPERVFASKRMQDRLSDHMGVKVVFSFGSSAAKEPTVLANQTIPSNLQALGELTTQ